ncbi:MAG: pantetheine-phosphate adenylyltransferase [Clostridiales bacterium]|nr:pantetheine-phosphate adenylyltransferase [Clostridiales bacterium]
MRTAIYPGSFDPVTAGHLDIIQRAAAQFDRLVVCVMYNSEKQGLFTPAERADLIRRSLAEMEGVDNVEVDYADGLLVDYARSQNANCVVKGLRRVADFEAEMQMADLNRRLSPGLDTLFLTARPDMAFLSSTIVKEMARYQVDLRGCVAESIAGDVAERMRQRLAEAE